MPGMRTRIIERHVDLSGVGDTFEEGPIGPGDVAGAVHVACQAEVVDGTLSSGELTLCGGVVASDPVALAGHSAADLGRTSLGTIADPVIDASTLRFDGLIVDADAFIQGQVATAEAGVRLRLTFLIVASDGVEAGDGPPMLMAPATPYVARVFEGGLESVGESFRAVDGGPDWISVGLLRRAAVHAFDLSGPAGGTAWSTGRADLRGQLSELSDWAIVSSSSMAASAAHARHLDLTPWARVRPTCSAAQAGVRLRVHVFCCAGPGYVREPVYRAYHSYDTPTNLTVRTGAAIGEYATTTIQSHDVE